MSMYIINDDWIREYERNIEELIGSDLEYDSATNPTPPLRKVDGTRWHELFGTPERAARTICRQLKHYNICICDGCPVKPPNKECDSEYDALLEWLRGESDD